MLPYRDRKYLFLVLLGLGLALLVGCGRPPTRAIAQETGAPSLSPPLDCRLDDDCLILLYSDRDPSPEAVDFGCGRQTYDGHKGTDFAIPDERAMARGVEVFPAAPGQVLRVRDGVEDRRVANQADRAAVEGTECGNGIVIDHGNGWETQYCHLRQNSIAVQPGDRVDRDTLLGLVGTSGLSSFPHVHLSVRHDGEIVDPFVGPNAAAGCQVSRNPLWNQPFEYTPTGLIRSGFSTEPPEMDKIWKGNYSETQLSVASPALLFWVQAYGVLAGDESEYRLTDPQGNVIIEHRDRIDSPSRTWLGYVGKKNTSDRPLTPGTWNASYRLTRGDRTLIDINRPIHLQ